MYFEPLPQRFPIPRIDTTARWGRRTRSLQRDPSMVALTHGLWAQWDGIIAPTDLQPWEVSALIASAVPHAAVSGLCAAAALQIPLMWGMNWVDGVLHQSRSLSRTGTSCGVATTSWCVSWLPITPCNQDLGAARSPQHCPLCSPSRSGNVGGARSWLRTTCSLELLTKRGSPSSFSREI